MAILTRDEFVKSFMDTMEDAITETMPEATPAEREEAKVAIMNAFAGSMFTAKMG